MEGRVFRPGRNDLGQVTPFDQLHHQCMRGAGVFEPVNRGDVRMIQRREHLRFAPKPREPIGVDAEGLGKDLQRDVAPELRVPRAIHLAHPAGAQGREDVVRPESRPRHERAHPALRSLLFLNP